MKFLKVILLLFLPMSVVFGQAQYYVVHVKGDIEVKSNNEKLKIGDTVSSEEELRFMDPEAKAVVMSTKDGRMLIDGAKSKKSDSGEFISYVKDVILPGKENIKLSVRGILDYDLDYRTVENFQKFFGTGKYVFIGDELKVGADSQKFPINDENRFIYRYETSARPVNKKLNADGNNLIFNRSVLYKTKGTQIDPDETKPVDLIYFNFKNNEAVPLASFEPVFVDEKTLALELKSIAGFLRSNQIMEQSEIKNELFEFILEVHGPINKNVFNDWLASTNVLANNN